MQALFYFTNSLILKVNSTRIFVHVLVFEHTIWIVYAGGGLFVDMMKRASQTKQFAELDHAIRTKVEPFLYNKGKGKYIPISKLVLLRNKERGRNKLVCMVLINS